MIFRYPDAQDDVSPVHVNSDFRNELIHTSERNRYPIIFMEDDIIYYGIFIDSDANCYIFGPVTRKILEVPEVAIYKQRHRIKTNLKVKDFERGEMVKILAQVFYHYSNIEIKYEDIMMVTNSRDICEVYIDGYMEKYQLEQSEEERIHHVQSFERKIADSIRSGDIDVVKKMMRSDTLDMNKIGVVAFNSYKQSEYLTVTLISLSTRFAVESGMNPEKAYQLGDVFLQRLEQCSTHADIAILSNKIVLEFTEHVAKAKALHSENTHIENSKDYIAKHLRKSFRISDMADDIGVNHSYLAREFSKSVGMTIQQYIMRERCSHAANLLKYSEYPISIISEYFCFASQSHFGTQFKKYYGETPREYRSKNQIVIY